MDLRNRPDRSREGEPDMRNQLAELQKKVTMMAMAASDSQFPEMTKTNHIEQMKFNSAIKNVLVNEMKAELGRLFADSAPDSLLDIIKKGEKDINFRMKCIAIADYYTGGWLTVNEYMGNNMASDEFDSKKLEAAEKRAQMKIDAKRMDQR